MACLVGEFQSLNSYCYDLVVLYER
jgi:hypothetical protein